MVEGEVLPIYHTVLFDPCVVEGPAPSQAHPTPKCGVVLSVLLRPTSVRSHPHYLSHSHLPRGGNHLK